jgi:hypothetical protein
MKRAEAVMQDAPQRKDCIKEADESKRHEYLMEAEIAVRENVEKARKRKIQEEYNEYEKLHPDD